MSRVIEVCREYRLPFVLTVVDYEKAFDSVETNAVLSALVDQSVNASYLRTLASCYDRCTTRIQLFHRPLTIPIGKGVRQGNTISLKLFTAALQWIMESIPWKERGICVDGRFLSKHSFRGRGVQHEGSQIVETSSYVYLGRSMNMENDLKGELNRRMRAAWAAFAAVREATD
ncbi:hypothetical protein RB195_024294 [Necator americanus]